MYPFERFSDEAKKVLTLAQQEAERAGHNYIGTEHLLLALLQQESEASRILDELGVSLEHVRRLVASVLGRSEHVVIQQIIPTSRVKKVIEIAFESAKAEASSKVTPTHLLIALMKEGQGIAAHVLGDQGVTLDAIAAIREGPADSPGLRRGARVLVHDPEPPYRLWEGSVSAHRGGEVTVVIPGHPSRTEVNLPASELHVMPIQHGGACERCRYPGEAPPR
jgi:Clp amino terminal domain, pathogenicity island component